MGFTEAIKSGYSRYFDFKERSSRSAFWNWMLYQVLAVVIICALTFKSVFIMSVVLEAWSLLHVIPTLGLTVRRLHDLNASGWFAVVQPIPVLNIPLYLWMIKRGTNGPNQYGLKADDISKK